MKVLVVDDYGTMRRIIRNLLGQVGFDDIGEAADGEDALHKLVHGQYDLVVSDWRMEPMSGLELLKAVRSNAKLKGIPFLLVTPDTGIPNLNTYKEDGISDYIAKPFNAAHLKEKIDGVLTAQKA